MKTQRVGMVPAARRAGVPVDVLIAAIEARELRAVKPYRRGWRSWILVATEVDRWSHERRGRLRALDVRQ